VLQLIVWQIGFSITPLIISGWGLDLFYAKFVSTAITTIVNNYVGVPLMQAHFGEWLRAYRTPNALGVLEFLDGGVSPWVQVAVFLGMAGLAIVSGALGWLIPPAEGE
jgi:hypothetical protein